VQLCHHSLKFRPSSYRLCFLLVGAVVFVANPAPAAPKSSAPTAKAVSIAVAEGMSPTEARSIVATLAAAKSSSGGDAAVLQEVERLSRENRQAAPAIAAAATVFAADKDFILAVAEAAGRGARSNLPEIAAAVSKAKPLLAGDVAASVALLQPRSTLRVTRAVARAVPTSVGGVEPPGRPFGLEAKILGKLPSAGVVNIHFAAQRGLAEAQKDLAKSQAPSASARADAR